MSDKKQNWDEGYSFEVKGRTSQEVDTMKKVGYCELPIFEKDQVRRDGFFCGSCGAFEPGSNSMPENPTKFDGLCRKYKFRDTSFSCCKAWYPANDLRGI